MTTARAVLHVGLPKTGTSFVQTAMRTNRQALAAGGVHLPHAEGERLFKAVLYLTDRSEIWGRSEDRGRTCWTRIVRDIPARADTTVVSHEILCLAEDRHIARILDDLGAEDIDVEVVVTVRDPARQVPAEWQEGVKHGQRMSYDDFLETVLAEPGPRGSRRQEVRARFWSAQDPVPVLDRWAGHVGPRHVHVVTCPPVGTSSDQLWSRFARMIGAEGVEVSLPSSEVNESLGEVQTEVLRRINPRLPRRGNERAYGDVVKRLYAGKILARQAGAKVLLPDRHRDRVEQVAESWIGQIRDRGYPVIGDLSDLRPRVAAPSDRDPVTESDLLDACLDATADLLLEVARLRAELASLRDR